MAASIAANACYVLTVQVLALVSLPAAGFGVFSIQYLMFALAGSISLSVICEPWLRSVIHDGETSSWRDYSSMLVYLAGAAGLATLAVSLLVPSARPVALSGAVAVFASTYRSGTRYHEVRGQNWNRILASDVSGIATTIAMWGSLSFAGAGELQAMSSAWAAGAIVTALISPVPRVNRINRIGDWLTKHKKHVRPLLRDSLLMDLGAIGTPFLIAPLLGIANFGVYRAVSNVAAPVRLVLNPLRPTLASISLTRHSSRKVVVGVVATSAIFGLGAYCALILIGTLQFDLGALTALVPFAAPTGLFVASNFLGHYYYVVARSHSAGPALLVGRLTQTVLSIASPIVGVLVWGLPGAIWGMAIATMFSAIVWNTLAVRDGRGMA